MASEPSPLEDAAAGRALRSFAAESRGHEWGWVMVISLLGDGSFHITARQKDNVIVGEGPTVGEALIALGNRKEEVDRADRRDESDA